jgi:hypothetical protein
MLVRVLCEMGRLRFDKSPLKLQLSALAQYSSRIGGATDRQSISTNQYEGNSWIRIVAPTAFCIFDPGKES